MKLKTLKIIGKIGKVTHGLLRATNLVTTTVFRAVITFIVVSYGFKVGMKFQWPAIVGAQFFVFFPIYLWFISGFREMYYQAYNKLYQKELNERSQDDTQSDN